MKKNTVRKGFVISLVVLLGIVLFIGTRVEEYAFSGGHVYAVDTSIVYFKDDGITTIHTVYFSRTATIYGKEAVFSPSTVGVYVNDYTVSYIPVSYTGVSGEKTPFIVFSTVPRKILVNGVTLSYISEKKPLLFVLEDLAGSELWWKFWIFFVFGPMLLVLSVLVGEKESAPAIVMAGLSIPMTFGWILILYDLLNWTVSVL